MSSPARRRIEEDPTATLRDGGWIQRAYELAEAAVKAGDHPFGAVLVLGNEVLGEAANRVNSASDLTRHAELELIGQAWGRHDPEQIAAATLYASTEPCVMCAGAIHWAGVRRVVYGTPASALAEIVGEPYRGVPLRELARQAAWQLEVVGPVMLDDGLRIHAEFWPGQGSPGGG